VQDGFGKNLAVGCDDADIRAKRGDRRDSAGILERCRLQHRE
jgi:hypothetical protein